MNKPAELKFGPAPLQAWAKEMELAILQRTPLNGEGTDINEQPDGFSVNAKPDAKTGGAAGAQTETIERIINGELMYQDIYVKGDPYPPPEP